MEVKSKAIVINLAIAAGLVVQLLRGKPLLPLAITAAILFPLANLLLVFSRRAR